MQYGRFQIYIKYDVIMLVLNFMEDSTIPKNPGTFSGRLENLRAVMEIGH
jgi:hypothetical protein